MRETPQSRSGAEKEKNPHIWARDQRRQGATELQRGVAEVQAARYESILYRLMSRTGNNETLINAMAEFIGELERRSAFGQNDKPLDKNSAEKLTKFFQDKAEELNRLVGNRAA